MVGSDSLWPYNRQYQNSLNLSQIVGFRAEFGFPSLVGIPRIEQPEFMDCNFPHCHCQAVRAGFIVGSSIQHVDVRFPLEEHGLLVHQSFDREGRVNRAFREILRADHNGQAIAQDMPTLQLGTQCLQGRRSRENSVFRPESFPQHTSLSGRIVSSAVASTADASGDAAVSNGRLATLTS